MAAAYKLLKQRKPAGRLKSNTHRRRTSRGRGFGIHRLGKVAKGRRRNSGRAGGTHRLGRAAKGRRRNSGRAGGTHRLGRAAKGRRRNSGRAVGFPRRMRIRGSAGAVICVPADPVMLRTALRQLLRLPLKEVVAVVLGDANPEIQAAGSLPNVRVVFMPDIQDFHQGRAAGAGLIHTDIVLFADGIRTGSAARLISFLKACNRGTDVALNNITSQLGKFNRWSRDFRMAAFLNLALSRRDLGASTLQVLPFALSRRALQVLGSEILASPLRAQAAALRHGLRVRAGGFVPLSAAAMAHTAWQADTGQHLAAWREALQHRGSRLSYPDRIRRRSVLSGGLEASVQGGIL